MTSMRIEPAGACVWKIVRTVGTAIRTRMTAGMAVQAISSAALPWIGRAAGPPGRLRYLMMVKTSAASTKTKTMVPQKRSLSQSMSVAVLRSVLRMKVELGYSCPPHAESATRQAARKSAGAERRKRSIDIGRKAGGMTAGETEWVRGPGFDRIAEARGNYPSPGGGARRKWSGYRRRIDWRRLGLARQARGRLRRSPFR